MNKRTILGIVFTVVLYSVIRLWVGVYVHDEFAERHLFIKHRPTWKWIFYSPIGMSDLKIEDLSEEKRFEQRMFEEFVKEKGLSL